MENKIRVGLIGFGIGGQLFHAPVFTTVKDLELVAIRAIKPDQVLAARTKYPNAKIVNTPEEICNDSDVDLVVISTPNTAHHQLATMALEAGKHVVIDKPITVTSAEADDLIALAGNRKLILSVYHNRRFDSDYQTVKKIIDNGLLGQMVEIESRYDRFRNYLKPGAWREEDSPGAGILYDLGSHLIDQIQDLLGLPEAITADLRKQRTGAEAIDNFEVIFHYPGIKATVKAGMLVRETLARFVVLGTQGSFVKYGMDVQEEALKAGHTRQTLANWGIEPAAIWGTLNTEINQHHFVGKIESEKGDYAAYYQNICDAINGTHDLIVTAWQARNTIRIIELAMQSQAEKRTVEFSFT